MILRADDACDIDSNASSFTFSSTRSSWEYPLEVSFNFSRGKEGFSCSVYDQDWEDRSRSFSRNSSVSVKSEL